MTKITENVREYYGIIHLVDVLKVLSQIEVIAREARPDELNDLNQEELDKLVGLLLRYYVMLKRLN